METETSQTNTASENPLKQESSAAKIDEEHGKSSKNNEETLPNTKEMSFSVNEDMKNKETLPHTKEMPESMHDDVKTEDTLPYTKEMSEITHDDGKTEETLAYTEEMSVSMHNVVNKGVTFLKNEFSNPILNIASITISLSDISLTSEDSFLETTSKMSLKTIKEPEPEEDFFEKLGSVPSISKMTESATKLPIPVKKVKSKSKPPGGGGFVNPLTGSNMPSSENVIEEHKQHEVIHVEKQLSSAEEFFDDMEEDEFSFDDFDAICEADDVQDIEDQPKKKEEDDLMNFFMPSEQDGKIAFKEESDEDKKQLEMLLLLEEDVNMFLTKVINQVVSLAEDEESTCIFRNKLSKTELFATLQSKFSELNVELSVCNFLNRKASEYYRRRQLFRFIVPEKIEQRSIELAKYKEASGKVDQLLGEEVFMTRKIASRIHALEIEKAELEKTVERVISEFENLVKTTLKFDGEPHLEEFVRRDLRKIRELGKDITRVRLGVIQQQHALGTLKEKIDKLEYIGNGLRVADYEVIQRQTIVVDKKIEDRNRDLNRFYDRFHSTLHILAHSKLRNELVLRRTSVQTRILTELMKDKAACRLRVYNLKKERKRIQRQINDLSLQSGLLDKPILLQDYDNTIERVEGKRKIVEELRQVQKKLEFKLKHYEKAANN